MINLTQTEIRPHRKNNGATQKLSAFTVALLVHVLLALLLGLVVVSLPRVEISLFTVFPVSELDESDIVCETPRLHREPNRSSPGVTMPTIALSVNAPSAVNVPAFEENQSAALRQVLAVGQDHFGRGFVQTGPGSLDGRSGSEVNFFSIRSRGRRIVFIIEASPYMLTDQKGGIPAYRKVKDEISQMLVGLNQQTAFNMIVYDGKKVATYQDELVEATPSNVRKAIEWFAPINEDFEHIGLSGEHSSRAIRSGVEPFLLNDLTHYIKATQRALEMDVDTIFLLSNGWGWHRKSMENREYEKWMRKQKWGEKEEAKWAGNVKKARAWLDQENERRLAQGVPRRVVTSLNEIVSELMPGVRHKPGPSYSMEDVQDQLKNSVSLYYRVKGKPRPKFNVVWFVGEDEKPNAAIDAHLRHQSKRNRGKMVRLPGMVGLKNLGMR
ncbi:MAG: hypothetical protein QM496_00605 [Verrucomicrobiota bacterium]